MTTIFGLRYKYESETGQSLIFYERNGNELTTQDLHNVQLKMIHSNRIPHTLPLSVENLDLKTTLHYDITARRKISRFLRNHHSTMNDYYQLFLSIIKTLEDCSSYMLNQQNYILNKEFIYIGENIKDVYLTYLPITELKRNTTITDDIKNLLTDIANDIQGLQGNEFKSILNYISDDSFSLAGLKRLLLDLISVRSNVHQPDETAFDEQPQQFDDLLPNNFSSKTKQPKQSKIQKDEKDEDESGLHNKQSKEKLPPLTSREVIFLIVGAVFLLGITWKIYDMFPYPILLIVCIAISLYIVLGVFVYWKIWRPGVKKVSKPLPVKSKTSQPPQQSEQAQSQQSQKKLQPNLQQKQKNFQPQYDQLKNHHNHDVAATNLQQSFDHQLASEKQSFHSQQFTEHFHQDRYSTGTAVHQHQPAGVGQHYAGGTSFKSPNLGNNHDDTVLLDEDENLDTNVGEQRIPQLTKINELGQEEKIYINSNHFLVGRNQHSVDYVESSIGVSRIHIEIVKIDETTYAIKDLGSKNGTKVNSDKLIPYKIYALNEHDEIEIGRTTYTFSWSHNE